MLRAYGGREAIEMARREFRTSIVLDLMMPDVNGFDVVDALRKGRYGPHSDHGGDAKRITAEDRANRTGL